MAFQSPSKRARSDKQEVCTLIHAGYVVMVQTTPVSVLEEHSIAIKDRKIVDILPTEKARAMYTSLDEVELGDHVIIPGLINAHTHTPMNLLRGYADDVPLLPWLQEHIWPAEQKWVNEEFCRDGTELAIAEMIRSGTTCFNDMYFFPEASAQVAEATGIRALIGAPVLMFPTAYASGPSEYLEKGLRLLESYKHSQLVSISLSPHAPYTVTDQQLDEIAKAARAHNIVVDMHVHETVAEVEEEVKKTGKRSIARLDEHGLLDSSLQKFVGVHMTAVTEEEIELFAKRGASVVHCPESNTKLASGFCPVQKMLAAGVNVCLGTDGAASNNDLDMFGEMRTAALLGKLEAKDASAVSASTVLQMATINGARALGLDKVTGSIEVGKEADLVAVRLDTLECTPLYDVVSHLVYAIGREHVSWVWVAGVPVLERRNLTTINQAKVLEKAKAWGAKIKLARANNAKP